MLTRSLGPNITLLTALGCALTVVSCGSAPTASESTGVVASAAKETSTLHVLRVAAVHWGNSCLEPESGCPDGGEIEILEETTGSGSSKERVMSVHLLRVDVDEATFECVEDDCGYRHWTEWRAEGPIALTDAIIGDDGTASVYVSVTNTATFTALQCDVTQTSTERVVDCQATAGLIDVTWSSSSQPTVTESSATSIEDGVRIHTTTAITSFSATAVGSGLGFAVPSEQQAFVSEIKTKTRRTPITN